MKTYTLYSLFFMKNVIRLFFITLMIEYLFILFWWNTNPYHHTSTVWMPVVFTLMYSCFIFVFYQYRLKYEKIKLDEFTLFYYKQRFQLSHISFYPVEKLNDKIRIIAFKAESDKTFIFSLFFQKKRYEQIINFLKLNEVDSSTI
ncbi:MAG: hypothetical protein ACRCV7_02700 [Culicoidibacterales bacterium]